MRIPTKDTKSKKAYASAFWRCIDQKQNFMHKLFFPIPEEALS